METDVLMKSPLFRGLLPVEVGQLMSQVMFAARRYKPGSIIAVSGETVSSFHIVAEGVVKGEMTDIAGRVIKIEDIPAGGALAPAFMFGNKNKFPVNVLAVTDCKILIIDKQQFIKLLVSDQRILVNFLDMISNRSQFLSDKIKFLNFKTIKGKLAQLILQNSGTRSNIRLEMTQNELADYFGVARPSVARALADMEEDGFIIATGKNIEITDKNGLASLTKD